MESLSNAASILCLKAIEIAKANGQNVTVVAVDKGGHLVALNRSDTAAYPSIEAARRKAVAAASFGLPSGELLNMFGQDGVVMNALQASGDILVVPGGFPIIIDGVCAGGLGIAGGHYTDDVAIGEQALA